MDASASTSTGAVRIPSSHAAMSRCEVSGVDAAQNRSRSAASSSTTNAQPWLNPALGARTALRVIRSTASAGTGSPVNRRCIRRLRTTS
nr:hypothetical protein GCM10025730_36450 [Promicromonospora thailandica]